MKYNFNFVQREQYKSKKAITNKEKQHVQLPLPYSIFTKYNQLNIIPKKVWCPYLYKNDISLNEILYQIEKVWPKHVYKYREDLENSVDYRQVVIGELKNSRNNR